MVLVRDISFAALSSTNLLPFHGHCHIAYIPKRGVILGLSKLARVARCLASRVQSQQQFADDLMEAVATYVRPSGVAVVVEALNLGMSSAPTRKVTISASGCYLNQTSGAMAELAALLGTTDLLSYEMACPEVTAFAPLPYLEVCAAALPQASTLTEMQKAVEVIVSSIVGSMPTKASCSICGFIVA